MQEREAQLGALADSQARMAAQCDSLGEELQAARSQMHALQVRVEFATISSTALSWYCACKCACVVKAEPLEPMVYFFPSVLRMLGNAPPWYQGSRPTATNLLLRPLLCMALSSVWLTLLRSPPSRGEMASAGQALCTASTR